MVKTKFKEGYIAERSNGDYVVTLHVPKGTYLNDLKVMLDNDNDKVVEIKRYRKKRSLDANGALWHLLGLMAEKLSTTKEELYREMIIAYGQFEYLILKEEAFKSMESYVTHLKEVGRKTENGVVMIKCIAYLGSSQYNTKQFSHLLEGVINEAKNIGIDFMNDEERALLMKEYEKERER